MTGFLAELGRRLAERWFTLLVLPGLGYLMVAVAAAELGRSGWSDWRALGEAFAALTQGEPDRQNALAVRAVLLIVAALPLSAGLGLLAQALAGPVERALAGAWPRPFTALAARRTARRSAAWHAADAAYRAGGRAEDAARATRSRSFRRGTRPGWATGCTLPPYGSARSTASTWPPSGPGCGCCCPPPPATPSPRPAPASTPRSRSAAGRCCICRWPSCGGRPR